MTKKGKMLQRKQQVHGDLKLREISDLKMFKCSNCLFCHHQIGEDCWDLLI